MKLVLLIILVCGVLTADAYNHNYKFERKTDSCTYYTYSDGWIHDRCTRACGSEENALVRKKMNCVMDTCIFGFDHDMKSSACFDSAAMMPILQQVESDPSCFDDDLYYARENVCVAFKKRTSADEVNRWIVERDETTLQSQNVISLPSLTNASTALLNRYFNIIKDHLSENAIAIYRPFIKYIEPHKEQPKYITLEDIKQYITVEDLEKLGKALLVACLILCLLVLWVIALFVYNRHEFTKKTHISFNGVKVSYRSRIRSRVAMINLYAMYPHHVFVKKDGQIIQHDELLFEVNERKIYARLANTSPEFKAYRETVDQLLE